MVKVEMGAQACPTIIMEPKQQRNPFKISVASCDRFCNRVAEIGQLCSNMRSGIHTVVYAPRRYGKTSLSRIVMGRLQDEMTCIHCDLFSITSSEDVAEKIYKSIVDALGVRAVDKSSLASKIATFFKRLRIGVEYSATGLPEFSLSLGDTAAAAHLEEIISSLDAYCEAIGNKVCLVLDEFQEICNLTDSKTVEALLRNGMQMAKHVTFMIMGSRRTILKDMFEDKKRPFYKSAYVMTLPQINKGEFVNFLIRKFQESGAELTQDEAEQIVDYTEAYPYYTQKLAMIYFDMRPSSGSLDDAKRFLIEMESSDYEGIYLGLTNHQKRLLKAIAKSRPANIFAGSFLVENRLGSQGGVQSSLVKLKKLDLVEQQAGSGWRVTDPILAKWILL